LIAYYNEVTSTMTEGKTREGVVVMTSLCSIFRAFYFSDWRSGRSGTKGIQISSALVLGMLVLNMQCEGQG